MRAYLPFFNTWTPGHLLSPSYPSCFFCGLSTPVSYSGVKANVVVVDVRGVGVHDEHEHEYKLRQRRGEGRAVEQRGARVALGLGVVADVDGVEADRGDPGPRGGEHDHRRAVADRDVPDRRAAHLRRALALPAPPPEPWRRACGARGDVGGAPELGDEPEERC